MAKSESDSAGQKIRWQETEEDAQCWSVPFKCTWTYIEHNTTSYVNSFEVTLVQLEANNISSIYVGL